MVTRNDVAVTGMVTQSAVSLGVGITGLVLNWSMRKGAAISLLISGAVLLATVVGMVATEDKVEVITDPEYISKAVGANLIRSGFIKV